MSSKDDVTRLPKERPGQPGGKRDLNRRKRRAQLREAGLRLFLAHGVERVTIDDIAKDAGTAKGNFYRYFDDKADLIAGIIEPTKQVLLDAIDRCEVALEDAHDEPTLFAAYQTLAISLAPLAFGERDVIRLYLQESRAPEVGSSAPIRVLANEIRRRAIELTAFAVDKGLLEIRDPRISALAVIGATEQLSWSLLNDELDASPAEIGRTLISLVLSGIQS